MVGDEEQMTFYPRPKTRGEAFAWIDRNHALYKELRVRVLVSRVARDSRVRWLLRDQAFGARGRFGDCDWLAR